MTEHHADLIREKVSSVDLVGAELWQSGVTAKYRGEATDPNLSVCGGTPEYPPNNTHYVRLGRNLTNEDVRVGRFVVVIGHELANTLFPFTEQERCSE